MDLRVERLRDAAPTREVEVVERKGTGHPDTICDALAEEVSVALGRFYLERFGMVLHHNVDKVLLVGGASRPAFGGGEIVAPIEITIAGRATRTVGETKVPVEELSETACRSWLRRHIRHLDAERHVKIRTQIRPGSAELVDLFARQAPAGLVLANDTSVGVGYAPLSPLEQSVLHVEVDLRSEAAGRLHPEVGEDVKVMAVRHGEEVELTVAAAFVDRFVRDLSEYEQGRERLRQRVVRTASEILEREVAASVNTADDLSRGKIYLTVSGTSAEGGDDGEAGRGNRHNGLITPCRPMTMESVAGKNPVSHVGKVYNLIASRIAQEAVTRLSDVSAAECMLVSRIGAPVRDPWLAVMRVATPAIEPSRLAPELRAVIEEQLAETMALVRELLAGEVPLY